VSGHGRPALGVPWSERFYNATARRDEVEREVGRKAGSKVPPALRKARRRKKGKR
jgi:hypothetical protein